MSEDWPPPPVRDPKAFEQVRYGGIGAPMVIAIALVALAIIIFG